MQIQEFMLDKTKIEMWTDVLDEVAAPLVVLVSYIEPPPDTIQLGGGAKLAHSYETSIRPAGVRVARLINAYEPMPGGVYDGSEPYEAWQDRIEKAATQVWKVILALRLKFPTTRTLVVGDYTDGNRIAYRLGEFGLVDAVLIQTPAIGGKAYYAQQPEQVPIPNTKTLLGNLRLLDRLDEDPNMTAYLRYPASKRLGTKSVEVSWINNNTEMSPDVPATFNRWIAAALKKLEGG